MLYYKHLSVRLIIVQCSAVSLHLYVCMYVCMYIHHTLISVGSLVAYMCRHDVHVVVLTLANASAV